MKQGKDYIDDPDFLRWVFRPDGEVSRSWEQYLEAHPDEKPAILKLKEELSRLKLKNDDLSPAGKEILLAQIVRQRNETRRPIRLWHSPVLRYAAVAIIFLVLGNIMNAVFRKEPVQTLTFPELTYLAPGDRPLMLLADGREIALGKNSSVTYLSENNLSVDGRTIEFSSEQPVGQSLDQVYLPQGHRCKMTLSDGSVVYLNGGSKFVCPSAFKRDTREVALWGEAFFEVSRNPDARFVVQTAAIAVEVFGTKFNVSAYDEDPLIQTVLVEGQVAVRRKGPSDEKPIVMKPDQLVTYNRQTHGFETSQVDPALFTMWKDGILKFENEELAVVTRKLERIYNMKLIFKDPQKAGVRISGKLDLGGSRSQVLSYLETLTGMQVSALNDTYYVIN